MRHLKKICDNNAGPIGFTIFYTSHLLDFLFTNAAIVTFKDETSK